jgi:endonuclease-3
VALNVARESRKARATRARAIARGLAKAYPDAWCELDYRSPWELLIATILSAQCTDKMVNRVTPALFAAFSTPAALAVAGEFQGKVPDSMEALTALPGIGRKTANVVLGTAFGRPAIFVDTHVKRLANRLGLTTDDDPVRIERDLGQLLPRTGWTLFAHRLIHHGRQVCFARRPRCSGCQVARWCPRIGVTASA